MSEAREPLPAAVRWLDDPAGRDLSADPIRFDVDGVPLVCSFVVDAAPGRLAVLKAPALVTAYVERLAGHRGGNVVELGIRHGGSTALLAALLSPRRMVGLELATDPLPSLEAFLVERGLTDVVRVHLGVDQADVATVGRLVDEGLDGPIDVVVDDASHLYHPTRASFLELFPRLRPGGLYVIEDWSASTVFAEAIDREPAELVRQLAAQGLFPPLERLSLEVALVAGVRPDLVTMVSTDRHWTVVTRGHGSTGDVADALADALADRFGILHALA